MTPADFYRMFASIAADMAVDATDPVQRTSLLQLAWTGADAGRRARAAAAG